MVQKCQVKNFHVSWLTKVFPVTWRGPSKEGLNSKTVHLLYRRGSHVPVGVLLNCIYRGCSRRCCSFNPSLCCLLTFHLSYVAFPGHVTWQNFTLSGPCYYPARASGFFGFTFTHRGNGERSDDRKYFCGSQATLLLTHIDNFILIRGANLRWTNDWQSWGHGI